MKKGNASLIICAVSFHVALIFFVWGCQTQPPKPERAVAHESAEPAGSSDFSPVSPISPIAFEQGKYADLFSPDSYAVWIDSAIAEKKKEEDAAHGITPDPWLVEDAGKIIQEFVVIELHTESVFADTSIAYDIVGLRGVSVYLETGDGKRIEPIQKIIGTPVEEEQRGALKAFRRTNVLVFARQDIWSGEPILQSTIPALKLVLESHDSRFAFHWNNTNQATGNVQSPLPLDKLKLVRVGFSEIFEQLRRLDRITQ